MREVFKIGQRITLAGCLLERITSYEVKGDRGSVMLYRHSISTPHNGKVVYTGSRIMGAVGLVYQIRGTVKRYENEHQFLRISRPIFSLQNDDQKGMVFSDENGKENRHG